MGDKFNKREGFLSTGSSIYLGGLTVAAFARKYPFIKPISPTILMLPAFNYYQPCS
jgi:hypothetical protein